ncbi:MULTISPECIES: hypothetical protein [Aquitalea]|jgi:hypothetical protein|uniref:hypothetical protein n=1 Tax=Aquitalea TaxID=407217 RepID=UPI00135A3EFA|nr:MULTISPECIES: hypothetical protein [Aquitalea]
MNTPANTNKPASPPEAELRTPENENTLATMAMPLGETVLTLSASAAPIYGILHRSRAMTGQSDFFRLQFRGFARIEGNQWQHYANDDARFHTTYNCAWVRVDHPSHSVTFGPKNGVNCTEAFAGQGLDTFLFAQTIAWVKGIYPDYAISPGMIAITGNASEEEKLRRNAFYASQGFQFDWQDAAQRTGLYFKDKISRLLGVWDKEHIQEVGGEAMLQSLAMQDESRLALEEKVALLESAHSSMKSALQKERNTSQILMGVLIIGVMLALWAVI